MLEARNCMPPLAEGACMIETLWQPEEEPAVLVVEVKRRDPGLGFAFELRVERGPAGLLAFWLTEEGALVKLQWVGLA